MSTHDDIRARCEAIAREDSGKWPVHIQALIAFGKPDLLDITHTLDFVRHAPADMRALLDENTRLRRALAALVARDPSGSPGGYADWNDIRLPDLVSCIYCGSGWEPGGPEQHTDDCPVLVARHELGEGAL